MELVYILCITAFWSSHQTGFCSSLLAGLPASVPAHLQSALNTVALVILLKCQVMSLCPWSAVASHLVPSISRSPHGAFRAWHHPFLFILTPSVPTLPCSLHASPFASCHSSHTLGTPPSGPLHVLPWPGKLSLPLCVGRVPSTPSNLCQLGTSFTLLVI